MAVRQNFEVRAFITGAESVQRGLTNIARAMKGVEVTNNKVTRSASAGVRTLNAYESRFDKVQKTAGVAGSKMAGFAKETDKVGRSAGNTGSKMARLELGIFGALKAGVLLGIVWQGINVVLTTAGTLMSKLAFRSVDLESSMISLSAVAKSTGRNIKEISAVIEDNIDALTDRMTLTRAVTRLLSTSLTTEQIDKYIKAVKDGAAAMGEDFNVQIERMALGLKRLEPRIADNVGAEFKLNIEYRQAAKELKKLQPELTAIERQQAFYNAVIRETSSFQGVWVAMLETTKGKLAGVEVEFNKLAETISTTQVWGIMATGLTGVIRGAKIFIEVLQVSEEEMGSSIDTAKDLSRGYGELSSTINQLESLYNPFKKLSDGYDELSSAIERLEQVQTDMQARTVTNANETELLNKRIFEVRYGVNLFTDGLLKVDKSLTEYNVDLRKSSKELSFWTHIQREAEGAVTELERAILSKQKALAPGKFLTTEDKLIDVQKDLADAQRDAERAQENLLKRVEPTIFKGFQSDLIESQERIISLTEEEESVKSKLRSEISNLQKDLSNEARSRDLATQQVVIYKEEQERLNSVLQASQTEIALLTDETALLNKENDLLKTAIEDDIAPALKDANAQLLEMKRSADSASGSVKSLVDNLNLLILSAPGLAMMRLLSVVHSPALGFGVPVTPSQLTTNQFNITITGGANKTAAELFNEIEIETRRRMNRRV